MSKEVDIEGLDGMTYRFEVYCKVEGCRMVDPHSHEGLRLQDYKGKEGLKPYTEDGSISKGKILWKSSMM